MGKTIKAPSLKGPSTRELGDKQTVTKKIEKTSLGVKDDVSDITKQ